MNDKKSTLHRLAERLRIAQQGGSKGDVTFLLQSADGIDSQEACVKWLERLLVWIRLSGGASVSAQTSLKFLITKLDQNARARQHSAQVTQKLMLQNSSVYLFSDAGVHSNYEFFKEGVSRLVKKFFPAGGDARQMETALTRIFHRENDPDWIAQLTPELKLQISQWLFGEQEVARKVKDRVVQDAAEACTLICVRASAIAIRRDVVERSDIQRTNDIPVLLLRAQVENYFAALLAGGDEQRIADCYREVESGIAASRRYFQGVHSHLEQFGVSVGLVFGLEAAESLLGRLDSLVRLARWLRFPAESFDPWHFFVTLLRESRNDRQLFPLVRSNFRLLAKKIVERSGATGENYITANSEEYHHMFFAALGGGFVTAFTGLVKFLGPQEAAPFVLGLYAALNYSLSFVLMHHLHFKLATKQPAMTAAALAERLKSSAGERSDEFINLVARISRSQFAAVAGNILAVIPTAFLINYASKIWRGHPTLTEDYALYTLHTLHPWTTLTIFYAFLTGVILWFSGVITGWVENAYVYYRVPKALARHQFLENFLGDHWLGRLIGGISGNISGWSSSISLGFMLAFIPVFGKFFGLPIDVRHVTLSTGSAAFAFGSIGHDIITSQMVWITAAGIICIAIMNFGVSFSLALNVAVRANNVSRRRLRTILRSCLNEFLARPLPFFFPVKPRGTR